MTDTDPDPSGDGDGNGNPPTDAGGRDDPRSVSTVVVDRDDVVTALESNRRGRADGRTVLRVTPPFSGRMRARIHRERDDPDDHGRDDPNDPAPVYVPPEQLVADPPPYPHPDDVEDDLRSDPDIEYTRERHRQRQVAAVERWRERVGDDIVDEAEIDLPDGSHTVDVSVLG